MFLNCVITRINFLGIKLQRVAFWHYEENTNIEFVWIKWLRVRKDKSFIGEYVMFKHGMYLLDYNSILMRMEANGRNIPIFKYNEPLPVDFLH